MGGGSQADALLLAQTSAMVFLSFGRKPLRGVPCLFLQAGFPFETQGLPWEPVLEAQRPSVLTRLSLVAPGISK